VKFNNVYKILVEIVIKNKAGIEISALFLYNEKNKIDRNYK